MKKILIMIMSCNDSFFIEQEKVIKETWLKNINKYNNIDYCIYRGEIINNHSYDKTEHLLRLRVEDNLENTFKKTYYAFKLANKIYDYDYIFRTNTSTFVNIELLNKFIQQIKNDEVLWSSEVYSLSNSFTPYPLYLYGRGNGLIFSKKIIDIILNEGFSYLYLNHCDDWLIGNILNSYWIKQKKNYLDYIKSYKHGWYNCVGVKGNNGHQLCIYGNDNKDWNFLNQFITIQIKRYREREIENNNYYEVQEVFENNNYNEKTLEKNVNDNFEYSKNPPVFIGSILGYINYDEWLNFNKTKLYYLQVNNKASDDEERYKNENRIWL